MAICIHNLDSTICHFCAACRHGHRRAACPQCGGQRIDHRPKSYERPETAGYDERVNSVQRSAIRSGHRASTRSDDPSLAADALTSQELVVLELLKEWRLQRSRDDSVPAYVIAHDRTLVEIARARPASEESLLDINGIGPAKVELYGAAILEVLRSVRLG